jgi:hypothetical protein
LFLAIAPFEYEVYPVVRKSSNITRISQLQGKKFCHSGYGYEPQWTKVLSEVGIFQVDFITEIIWCWHICHD